jgi:hypothetical protein
MLLPTGTAASGVWCCHGNSRRHECSAGARWKREREPHYLVQSTGGAMHFYFWDTVCFARSNTAVGKLVGMCVLCAALVLWSKLPPQS